MKTIALTQDKFAIVDDEDYEYLMQWKWHVLKMNNLLYAARSVRIGDSKKTIYMHRTILDVSDKSIVVDHKDHNALNNQKSNIRICTQRDNMANKRNHGKSSKYIGVRLFKRDNKFFASIQHRGTSYFLGSFVNEKDAALAYNLKSTELNGQFANLNIID